MQFYFNTRLARRMSGFAAAVLGALALTTPVQASYVTANVNQGNGPTACGAINEPFLSCGAYNGPAVVEPGSKAYTDFGVNKVLAQGTDSATSEWMVRYSLSGTQGTPVNLIVEIGFHVNISAAVQSEALFRMVLNNDFFGPFDIRIATDGLGNICHDLPATAPCMSGQHSGVWTRAVEATAGPNNRLYLLLTGSVSNGGWVDAYNTVRINRIIVPDGVTWSYDDISGNPLNFQHANDTGVPEPAAAHLLAAGLAVAAIMRSRQKGV